MRGEIVFECIVNERKWKRKFGIEKSAEKARKEASLEIFGEREP